jgi:TIR domain
MANVFISHRKKDDAPAEKLAAAIRAAGHQVWFDEWEIGIGDSVVEKMNEGLEGSAYLILGYSDVGVGTPWISREWYSALARQMNGVGVKILPAVLTGGGSSAILADIKYANLTKDWDDGVRQLLKAIR